MLMIITIGLLIISWLGVESKPASDDPSQRFHLEPYALLEEGRMVAKGKDCHESGDDEHFDCRLLIKEEQDPVDQGVQEDDGARNETELAGRLGIRRPPSAVKPLPTTSKPVRVYWDVVKFWLPSPGKDQVTIHYWFDPQYKWSKNPLNMTTGIKVYHG